jgi:putative component of toxin-antitoxin plasmid stabilization module
LHELDLFVNQEFVEPSKTSGKTSKPNPKYTKIHTQISNKRQKLSPNYRYKKIITGTDRADVLAEIKSLEKRRAELRSSIDGDGFRIYYVRYADDFLIGVNGTYERAVKIRARIAEFLKEHLKLSLNMEKTKITSASEGRAAFLGADIRRYSSRIHDQKRVKRVTSVGVTRQRVPNSNIIALAPIEKLVKKLSEQGMCKIRNFRNRDVRSTSKSA